MSEEIFNSTIQEIKSIFQFLTEEEPTPDDEIEAREKLIGLFKSLQQNNTNIEISNFTDEVLKDLENWDTLELWFKEVESLIVGIKKILDLALAEKESEFLTVDIDASGTPSELEKSTQDSSAELIEIVAQVSEQFKGQIESLKGKIEALQEELDKKAEMIEELNEEQPEIMQDDTIGDYEDEGFEALEDSDSKSKASKLTPPKIHIPQFKVPPPLPKEEEPPLKISDMENHLSQMEIALQELADTEMVVKKPSIISEVVEEEVILTDIPKMPPSDLNEIPQAPFKVPEVFEDDLALSEIPKMTLKTKKEKTPQKKQLITPEVIENEPKDVVLTEIPKMVPDEVGKKQGLQIEVSEFDDTPEDFITIASKKESNITKNSRKKAIIPDVIEENPNSSKSSLEGSLFMPGVPRKEEKGINIPDSSEESIKVSDDAIFMLKKPSVKLDDISTESIKTTRTDLFDVFSSMPEHETEGNGIAEIAETEIKSTQESGEKSKKKKKKEVIDEKIKKKDKKKEKPSKPSELILTNLDIDHEEEASIDYDNLPDDKDMLYQDLIALEGKRYSVEKNFKELESKFTNRNINEGEFRKQSNKLTKRLKEISSNITKLRNAIAKL